jgi:valyl-tRNA synthetase
MLPEYNAAMIDAKKEEQMKTLQTVLELGRKIRERRNISLKQPVKEMVVVAGNQELLDGLKVRAHCDAHPAHIAHFTLHTSCRPPPIATHTAHCHLIATSSALSPHFLHTSP